MRPVSSQRYAKQSEFFFFDSLSVLITAVELPYAIPHDSPMTSMYYCCAYLYNSEVSSFEVVDEIYGGGGRWYFTVVHYV